MTTKPIYITGFMGSGKTTIGKLLARKLGYRFVDLDKMIEEYEGKTITELFELHHENGFRLLEKKYLQLTTQFEKTIISCGGGTPCFFDNIEIINKHGISLYLEMTVAALHTRLINSKTARPLIVGKTDDELKDFIKAKLQERETFYKQAHFSFNALNGKSEEGIATIIQLLQQS
jgi:shikimate kinase